jgi:hypothetical protein
MASHNLHAMHRSSPILQYYPYLNRYLCVYQLGIYEGHVPHGIELTEVPFSKNINREFIFMQQ